MKQKILLLGIVFLSFCYGCSNKQTENLSVIAGYNQTGKLIAKIQKTQNTFLLPVALLLVGDNLIVHKLKEDYMFDVYSVPECKYLFSSGRRGQGPNDFINLDHRSFQAVSENEFKVMDNSANFYKTIFIEDNQLIVKHSEFTGFRFSNGFYPLADSVYLTLGDAGKTNEYVLFDKKNATLSEKGEYPKWTSVSSDDPVQFFFTYVKNCVVHPDGKKFAAFYGRFKRWRIYDQSAALLHDIDVRIPPCKTNIDDDPKYYIGQPQAIGDYIYALCVNIEKKQSDTFNVTELQIWDWDGNPVACFSFDRNLSMFVISEKHHKIIALNQLTENEFYIYDLPILKNR